jgi:hypothetical protein
MSRPLRVKYPGANDHVMCTGNARQRIFHDEASGVTGGIADALELIVGDVLVLALMQVVQTARWKALVGHGAFSEKTARCLLIGCFFGNDACHNRYARHFELGFRLSCSPCLP